MMIQSIPLNINVTSGAAFLYYIFLVEPVFIVRPKLLLIEFGIQFIIDCKRCVLKILRHDLCVSALSIVTNLQGNI